MNIYDRGLSVEEEKLLSKGLNFCPTRHFYAFMTLLDVNKFSRSLTLKKHYFESSAATGGTPPGDLYTGESPPSPIFFKEICALQDLTELASLICVPSTSLMFTILSHSNSDLISIQWDRGEGI